MDSHLLKSGVFAFVFISLSAFANPYVGSWESREEIPPDASFASIMKHVLVIGTDALLIADMTGRHTKPTKSKYQLIRSNAIQYKDKDGITRTATVSLQGQQLNFCFFQGYCLNYDRTPEAPLIVVGEHERPYVITRERWVINSKVDDWNNGGIVSTTLFPRYFSELDHRWLQFPPAAWVDNGWRYYAIAISYFVGEDEKDAASYAGILRLIGVNKTTQQTKDLGASDMVFFRPGQILQIDRNHEGNQVHYELEVMGNDPNNDP